MWVGLLCSALEGFKRKFLCFLLVAEVTKHMACSRQRKFHQHCEETEAHILCSYRIGASIYSGSFCISYNIRKFLASIPTIFIYPLPQYS